MLDVALNLPQFLSGFNGLVFRNVPPLQGCFSYQIGMGGSKLYVQVMARSEVTSVALGFWHTPESTASNMWQTPPWVLWWKWDQVFVTLKSRPHWHTSYRTEEIFRHWSRVLVRVTIAATKYHDPKDSWGGKVLFSLHFSISVHHQKSRDRNWNRAETCPVRIMLLICMYSRLTIWHWYALPCRKLPLPLLN